MMVQAELHLRGPHMCHEMAPSHIPPLCAGPDLLLKNTAAWCARSLSRCSTVTPSLQLQAGHAVHEDEATKTADVIAKFLQRFKIGQQMPASIQPRPSAAHT